MVQRLGPQTVFLQKASIATSRKSSHPDHGGVIVSRRQYPHSNLQDTYNQDRKVFLNSIDGKVKAKFDAWEDQSFESCISPSWSRAYHPVCNSLHEISRPLQHLGQGFFRDTFLQENDLVLKMLRIDFDFTPQDFDSIHKEALVLGDWMSSSHRFAPLYGHCGGSVTVPALRSIEEQLIPNLGAEYYSTEPGFMKQEKLDQWLDEQGHSADTPPRVNAVSDRQKLEWALTMTKSIAELHGFADGCLVHDDIQPQQWLLDRENNLVLNDVNNVVALAYRRDQHDYCPFGMTYGGMQRGPEEFRPGPVTEQADVFVMGLQLYTILTGLYPFYNQEDSEDSRQSVLQGQTPFVDPRWRRNGSRIERAWIPIMESCWAYRPEDRPTIFDLLKQLRELQSLV